MKPRLKSCPFCGYPGKLVTWFCHGSEPLYQVNCQNKFCPIQPSTNYKSDEDLVVAEWNNRQPRRNICQTCSNGAWDMPQCNDCNADNGFQWYVKEKADAQV